MLAHASGVPLVFAALCAARSAVAQPPKAVAVKPDAEIAARLGQPAPDFTLKTLPRRPAHSPLAHPPKPPAAKPDAEPPARRGQPAPDFTLKTLAGTEVSLSSR